jgi:hypothetical protein
MTSNQSYTATRLTALWALSESGLGGMMHALKIPFTGFFLGGFAIVMVTLIAQQYTQGRFKAVLQATLLVILVKAMVSPHSPPMAYIAVGFQGLAGACIYQVGFNRITCLLFGGFALFESAIQKFLTATLIFGKSIWDALDGFFNSIAKDLGLSGDFPFSFLLIVVYTGIYVIWGMVIGSWSFSLQKRMENEASTIIAKSKRIAYQNSEGAILKQQNKRKMKLISIFFILIFIASVILVQDGLSNAVYAVFRSVAALLLLFYFIGPLVKYFFQKWIANQQHHNQQQIRNIVDAFPEIKSYINPAMQMAKEDYTGLLKYRAFVFNLIVMTLYHKQ